MWGNVGMFYHTTQLNTRVAFLKQSLRSSRGPKGPGDCFIKALIFMEVVPESVSLLFYNIKSAIFTSNMECLT